MPAFTISGLGSGQNTNEIVSKLVELEKKPVKRWEKENQYNDVQVKAWKELKTAINTFEERTKDIISITTPLALKKVLTDDGSVTGEAGRVAKQSTRKIEVIDLASKHMITGEKVKRDIQLPAGEFTIKSGKAEAKIEFEGGDLKFLSETIRKQAADVAGLTLVNIDAEFSVFSMTSNHSGKKGELKIIDNNGILALAGLVGKNSTDREYTTKDPGLNFKSVAFFNQTSFSGIEGSVPGRETDKIILPAGASHVVAMKEYPLEKETFLRVSLPVKTEDSKTGLPEKEVYLGVQYETPSGTRTIFRAVKGKKNFRLYLKDIKGHKLTGIILGNQGIAPVEYASVKLVEAGDLKGAEPLHNSIEAKDAKFKIDGIEVTRDTNENLGDVLEGMSITLNKTTEAPVDLKVQIELDKGLELIREFVKAHNDLILFSRDLTLMDKSRGPENKSNAGEDRTSDISENYWEKKSRTGILAGDNTLLRLISGVNRIMAAAYPSDTDPKFRVLADVGLSTGAVNEKWKETKSKKGTIEINENELKNSIEKSPEAVKELFASDLNHDSRMDDGVGVKLIEHLKPFTQFSTGIVESKIRMLESLITDNNKKIKSYDSHLASYEKKLKTKFMYMEQGVGKNKAVGSYLRNNLSGARGDN